MRKFLFIYLLNVILCSNGFAIEQGRQPFKNFSYREYSGHYQNWAVVQDKRGFIYVANNSGILEFDGSEWRTIPVGNVVTRCLDVDEHGRVWVGAQDLFGYLAPDSLGSLQFNSLNHLIQDVCKPMGLVRQVYATPKGVYFSSNSCMVRIDGNEVTPMYPKSIFHRTYLVNGQIFSVQPGIGLTYLKNDTLVLAPAGERFAQVRIYAMLPYDQNTILIATQSDGFFLYNTSQITGNSPVSIYQLVVPFKTSNNKFFSDNWVYHGITLPNNLFAFGTYRGGVVVINRNGDIVQHIGKEQGIQDETVWHLNADNQGYIWMALNNGISYSAVKSAITSWESGEELLGVLQSVKNFKGNLYVSSNVGVFVSNGKGFHRVNETLDLSWDIFPLKSSDGKETLVVASGNGIYELSGDKAKIVDNGKVGTFHLYQSKKHPDIAFLGLYQGLGVLKYSKGKWSYVGSFEGVTDRILAIAEDEYNNLWFVERLKGIVRVKISNPLSLKFDEKFNYPEIPYNPGFDDDTRIFSLKGKIKVSSPKGLASFNQIANTFEPDSLLGTEFTTGKLGIKLFSLDINGNLWYETYSQPHIRRIKRAKVTDDGSCIILPVELNEIPQMIFSSVDTDSNGISWIAGADGLYRFDQTGNAIGIKIPSVYIRRVVNGNNKFLFGGTYGSSCPDGLYQCFGEKQNPENIPTLPFFSNTIVFHFSSPLFGNEGKMLYSFMLEGFDHSWSDWGSIRYKEYTNLPYGSYTFRVKAMSVYDVESVVATYSFNIERPWYFSPLMFVAYFFMLILIVIVSVGVKTRMLQSNNRKLQRMVNERTKEIMEQQRDILMKNEELQQQKEEIASQRDELENKGRLTNSSIQYALTIQQAILPKKTTLDKYFDSFILFMPKDIVSGDFYWFSQVQSISGGTTRNFVVVVDCTGHGVPGAFMSMIGNRMLSEIVNERKIFDPARILTELDKMLNEVLQQESYDSFDGMDVCLCSIDEITHGRYLISFAGANRPLAYYRQGGVNIEVAKGSKKSIGGILPNIDASFETQLIDLVAGDVLFLYTDGFGDQNNFMGKKFTTANLFSILLANKHQSMSYIGNILRSAFLAHKDEVPQRDDVTILGLKLR